MSYRFLGFAVAAIALTISACGSEGGNASSSPTATNSATTTGTSSSSAGNGGNASSEAVAWADKVCKAVEGQVGVLTKDPQIDTSNPQSAKDGMVKFLGEFGTALESLATGFKDAGAPPMPDTKPAVDKAVQGIEQGAQIVKDSKTKLEQAAITDAQALQQAFTEIGQSLSSVGALDATTELQKNPELEAAFKQAPTCRKLDEQQTSSAPTS